VAVYGPLGKTSAGSADTTVADPVVSTRTLINMVANMVASVAIVFLILASEVIVSVY